MEGQGTGEWKGKGRDARKREGKGLNQRRKVEGAKLKR